MILNEPRFPDPGSFHLIFLNPPVPLMIGPAVGRIINDDWKSRYLSSGNNSTICLVNMEVSTKSKIEYTPMTYITQEDFLFLSSNSFEKSVTESTSTFGRSIKTLNSFFEFFFTN